MGDTTLSVEVKLRHTDTEEQINPQGIVKMVNNERNFHNSSSDGGWLAVKVITLSFAPSREH